MGCKHAASDDNNRTYWWHRKYCKMTFETNVLWKIHHGSTWSCCRLVRGVEFAREERGFWTVVDSSLHIINQIKTYRREWQHEHIWHISTSPTSKRNKFLTFQESYLKLSLQSLVIGLNGLTKFLTQPGPQKRFTGWGALRRWFFGSIICHLEKDASTNIDYHLNSRPCPLMTKKLWVTDKKRSRQKQSCILVVELSRHRSLKKGILSMKEDRLWILRTDHDWSDDTRGIDCDWLTGAEHPSKIASQPTTCTEHSLFLCEYLFHKARARNGYQQKNISSSAS